MEEQVATPLAPSPEETMPVHQPPVAVDEKPVARPEVPQSGPLTAIEEKPAAPAEEVAKPNIEQSAAEQPAVPRLSDKTTFALETGTVVAASILGGIFLGPIGAMALGALVSGGCNYIKQCYDKGGPEKVNKAEVLTSALIGAVPGAGGKLFKGLFGGLLKFSPAKKAAAYTMERVVGKAITRGLQGSAYGAAYGFLYPGAIDIANNPTNVNLISLFEKGKEYAAIGAFSGAAAGVFSGIAAGITGSSLFASQATRLACAPGDVLRLQQKLNSTTLANTGGASMKTSVGAF